MIGRTGRNSDVRNVNQTISFNTYRLIPCLSPIRNTPLTRSA